MSTSTTTMYNQTGSIQSNATFLLIENENDQQRVLYLPTLVILVILMMIGLLGNACVVVVYKLKFKRSSARVYIISLALADMSVCLVGLPYHIIDLTYPFNYQSFVTCKILSFLISSCTLSSILILLVVGLDRYLKVCRPLKKQIVDFGDRKACVIAAIIAMIFSLPYAFIYGNSSVQMSVNGYNITGSECFIDDAYSESEESVLGIGYLSFIILLFVLSVLYLLVMYGLIFRTIRRMDDVNITLHRAKDSCCCRVYSESIDDPDENADDECVAKIETVHVETQLLPTYNDTDNDLKAATVTSARSVEYKAADDECGTTIETVHDDSHVVPTYAPTNNDVNALSKKEALVTTGSTVEQRFALQYVERRLKKSKISKTTSNALIRHTISGTKGKEKHTRKITLMMLTITIVFIVTYLPFIAISMVDAIDDDFWNALSDFEVVFYDLILRIYLLNNIANPIIYSFMDVKFRREVVKILKGIFGCTVCDKSHQQGSEQSSSNSPQNTTTFILK
ncbi:D(2) dopamine receptor A-like [Dreissena polymorpha]|nr:D(2) dopamine receptor A-like [Dreissena polymorpha]